MVFVEVAVQSAKCTYRYTRYVDSSDTRRGISAFHRRAYEACSCPAAMAVCAGSAMVGFLFLIRNFRSTEAVGQHSKKSSTAA